MKIMVNNAQRRRKNAMRELKGFRRTQMRNRRFTRHVIKVAAYMAAAGIFCSQTMVGMATETEPGELEEDAVTSDGDHEDQTDTEETSGTETDGAESGGQEDGGEARLITAIAVLPAEQTYLIYEKKPSQEELDARFPETLTVTLDGAEDSEEIEVAWECGTDYEKEWSGEGKELYTFGPVWDEEVYTLSEEEAETVTIPTVTVEIAHEEVAGQIEDLETAQEDLEEITEQKYILAIVYLCEQYEVKEEPGVEADTVDTVVCGQSVQIVGVELDEAGNVWYEASFYDRDQEYTGYIEKRFLVSSDEKFLTWADEYVKKAQETPRKKARTISLMSTISSYPDVNQFPASYQGKLLALKQQYPNWTFVKMETGVDFNTAIAKELGDKNWISNSKPASWKNGAAAQSGWSYASEGAVRYYMDPRNFLTESSIFQFEQLTYNESYHTESAVQAIIANSFMRGDIPNEGMTYASAFTRIGRELKVSPFHLASRVLQEQGTNGTSALISGAYNDEFRGYYNYFNVGASGRDTDLILNGLREAKKRGWNSRYASLKGGASVISQNYIQRGQDTLYLQKFNVTTNNRYEHQYMQNVMAPSSEAPNIKKAYAGTGSLNNSFVFKIPVYGNMPASACSQPDTTDTITLNKTSIDSLAVDGTAKITPYVNGSRVDSVSVLTFASNNTGVATVDAQGVVKAVSPGQATITCSRSGAKSASCTVTVVKAEPAVDTPVLSPVVYREGLKLSDVALPERWSWSNGNTPLEAGTSSYPAVYTPADTTKYLTATRQIGIKVSQTIPICSVPEGLSAKLGSKLGSVALPRGFTWESDPETNLDRAGEQTFYLTYDPNDKNYLILNHIPVVVRVIDDSVQPQEPEEEYQGPQFGGDSGTGAGSGSGGSGMGGTGSGAGGSGSGSGGMGSGGAAGQGSADSGTTSRESTGSSGSGTTSRESTSSSGSSTESQGNPENSGTTSQGSTTSRESTSSSGSSTESQGDPGNSGMTSQGSTTSQESTGSSSPGFEGPGIEEPGLGGTSQGSTTTSKESTSGSGGTPTSKESTSGSGSTTTSKESTSSGSTTTSKESTSGSGSTTTSKESTSGSNTTTSRESTSGSGSTTTSKESTSSGSTTTSKESTSSGGSTGSRENTGSNSAINVSGAGGTKAAGGSTAGGNHSTLLANADVVTEPDGREGESREETAYERSSVTMDMEDLPVLTDEMLQMAKGQNVDLVLRMNDRAAWRVNAGSVQGSYADTDMNVLFDRGIVPQDLLEQLADGNGCLEFSLAHDGPFGFGAQLQLLLDPADCGRYANLFYYDSAAGTLEFICASVIDENGYAVFDMEHASDYVVIISDYPMTDGAEEAVGSDAPDAGFPWGRLVIAVVIIAALAALAAGGYLFFRMRRDDDEEEEEDDDDEEDNDDGEDEEEEDLEEIAVDDTQDGQAADGTYIPGEPEREAAQQETEDKTQNAEDDWIEDEDWHEEEPQEQDPYEDDHAENDWIDDDEWDIANDWIDDDEWERRNAKKTTA